MTNFFTDNDDLRYYVEKGIDWAPLVELTEFLHRAPDGFARTEDAVEMYTDVLSLVGDLAGDEIAPHVAQIDHAGLRFEDGEVIFPPALQGIFDRLRELELHGMCLPRELGGQNCPITVFFLVSEIIGRADISVMSHNSFHGAMAMAMLLYSMNEGSTELDPKTGRVVKTRFAEEIEEIRSGRAWGSMDITEPNAGSDMAALRAVAELDPDGQWYVSGTKIFITSGHGKHHFVIARSEPDLEGLDALSMFLVKAYEEDAQGNRVRIATVDRIEEKMGHHGSATCAVTFDHAPAVLIGGRGEGFRQMLTLMNNARIGVGFEAVGLCEAAYRLAKAYAAERRSMGKTIDRHEMIADYLDAMETDLLGLRALAVACSTHEETAQKTALLEDHGFFTDPAELERRRAQKERSRHLSRRLTPLLKYLGAEKAVELSRQAIQILGGAGYITEYGAEKLLRDALVLPIYEGTSQIQSLMVMKDTLGGALKNPRQFASRLAQSHLRARYVRDPLERRVAKLNVLSLSAQQHLLTRTAADKYRALKGKPISEWPERFMKNWDPKRDFAFAMLHAERLTRIMADEAIAEILLEQAKKHPERAQILERHLERAEPRARYLHEQITTTGQRLLDRLARSERDESRQAS